MPVHIIQHNNVFNVYTTIADGCYFESGLTLDELKEWYKEEYGNNGMMELDQRLERVLKKGTSAINDTDLKDTISCNRAGKNEEYMSYQKFIDKFLVINPVDRE